ncbi:hypothetical protein [Vibrio mangrovi]|uniref:Uncharacterized protein n=1 Tax=Vibrio mangrovi TaxID=474394 RepID=A0A1Y6ITK0_9VIBR|nr:hypothetical protein [Vibrio mangrovi]MDW6004718.1 hypothetical protein [Vibrio mangrovi]SMS01009.1 hypothetical protein VIM7927_02286 [Vibrio mangrovi]
MSLEQKVAALVEASDTLTSTVNRKITEIDQKVESATTAIPEAIRENIHRVVYVDALSGKDSNDGLTGATPVKTLNQAIELVPNGASGEILLRPNQTFEVYRHGVSASEKNLVIGSWGAPSEDSRPVIRAMPTTFNSDTEVSSIFEASSRMNIKFRQVEIQTGIVSDHEHYHVYGGSIGNQINSNYGGFFSRGEGDNELAHFEVQFIRCTIRQQDFCLFTFNYGHLLLSMSLCKVINEGQNSALCDKDVPKVIDLNSTTFEGFPEGASLNSMFKLTTNNHIIRENTALA